MVGDGPDQDETLVAIAAIGITLFINLNPYARMAKGAHAGHVGGAITGDAARCNALCFGSINHGKGI